MSQHSFLEPLFSREEWHRFYGLYRQYDRAAHAALLRVTTQQETRENISQERPFKQREFKRVIHGMNPKARDGYLAGLELGYEVSTEVRRPMILQMFKLG